MFIYIAINSYDPDKKKQLTDWVDMTDINQPILLVLVYLFRSIEFVWTWFKPLGKSNRWAKILSKKKSKLEKINKNGRGRLLFTSKGILLSPINLIGLPLIIIMPPFSHLKVYSSHKELRNMREMSKVMITNHLFWKKLKLNQEESINRSLNKLQIRGMIIKRMLKRMFQRRIKRLKET